MTVNGESRGGSSQQLTMQAVGITLIGVLTSIGVTVAFGITAPWWVRTAAGAGTTAALAVSVWMLGTRTTVLAKLADWITGTSYRGQHGHSSASAASAPDGATETEPDHPRKS